MRALRILKEVDYVLCEDTRVTSRLLAHYDIKTPTISYHQHSTLQKVDQILALFKQDKNLALVTDAGTPGISDPGGKLVQAVLEEFDEAVKIESVPGASAVTAALSISGINSDRFVFLGFPPHKKGRQTFIQKIVDSEYPVVVYESKHRIIKFLHELEQLSAKKEAEQEIEEALGDEEFHYKKDKEKEKKKLNLTSVVVCRELSKMHETVYRGDLDKIIKKIEENSDDQRGEFVVIISK
jgi:16S rRNA (cytidine1402-2'-O)-methyltransferase